MMKKPFISALVVILFLSSCSSLKPLNFSTNKPAVTGEEFSQPKTKFIEDISLVPQSTNTLIKAESKLLPYQTVTTRGLSIETEDYKTVANQQGEIAGRAADLENFSALQLKYAILLNIEVEQLEDLALLEGVDEWYGTKYRMGGTSKKGVDCSAFVGAVYASVFGVSLPRTARDQYRSTQRISRTELQEGDLLFFNTRGGVSHVGIYLRNNKFAHASVSKGVTVDDLYDSYYVKRFVGAGRIENKEPLAKQEP
jgi:hypothetical protein